jgi:hypothetical protein
MGYLQRRDFTKGSASIGYGWRPGAESRLLRYAVGLGGSVFRRNLDQVVETADVGPNATVETRGGHSFSVSIPVRHENLEEAFSLVDGVNVPTGTYDFTSAEFQYRPPMGVLMRANFGLETGQFYDGTRTSFSFGPGWNVSRYLNIDGTYRLDRVEFSDRDQGFTAHIARLRSELMFSNALSAIGFVQFNSSQNSVTANLRVRYNAREGNDLYIVWNEGLVTDRFEFTPVRPWSNQRTILVKYSHTFRLGI